MTDMTAVFDGGRAHGLTLTVPDARYVYVAMVDGKPVTVPQVPDEELRNRAYGLWECYVRDQESTGDPVRYFCPRPLDEGRHGHGAPPPPPAEEMRRRSAG